MRYAIFAATDAGGQLAWKVEQALQRQELGFLTPKTSDSSGKKHGFNPGTARSMADSVRTDVFIQQNHWRSVWQQRENWQSYHRLKELMEKAFPAYDGIVFIMAAGIAVRSIAPYLQDKTKDPAVVVMDDKGENVISLLSGHIGGGNQLTRYLAQAIGGHEVITTATDVHQLIAPDALAGELQLKVFPKENLVFFNSGLLAGKEVHYFIDRDVPCLEQYARALTAQRLSWEYADFMCGNSSFYEKVREKEKLFAVITDRWNLTLRQYRGSAGDSSHSSNSSNSLQELTRVKNLLILRPRKLIAGTGCRRHTECSLILEALEQACHAIGWDTDRLSGMASTEVKAEEKGLLQAAAKLGVPIKFFANEQLAEKISGYALRESEFVKQTIGVGNVCESSALCCVERGRIALPKTKYEKVTVALIWEK